MSLSDHPQDSKRKITEEDALDLPDAKAIKQLNPTVILSSPSVIPKDENARLEQLWQSNCASASLKKQGQPRSYEKEWEKNESKETPGEIKKTKKRVRLKEILRLGGFVHELCRNRIPRNAIVILH